MLKDLEIAVNDSNSLEELFIKLGYSKNPNSRTRQKVREALAEINISDASKYFREKRFPKIEKICPVCNKSFIVPVKDYKQSNQVTCSHSCANTHFRSGTNHPNFKEDSNTAHRTICFQAWGKACIVCDEDIMVDAHHMDENHFNNDPSNLVPLCPTHHQYWHSKYRHIIEGIVLDYVKSRNLT